MEFSLIYTGPLPTSSKNSSRAKEKQQIRREFHKQLKTLWETHPFLSRMWCRTDEGSLVNKHIVREPTLTGCIMSFWSCGGFRFLPLVTEHFGLAASIHIDFLRQGRPGDLIDGGDIDNRLKTLIDALRMPHDLGELAGDAPTTTDELFYVVLEDDCLITGFSVETNQLLAPIIPTAKRTDVWLKVHVTVKAINVNQFNLALM